MVQRARRVCVCTLAVAWRQADMQVRHEGVTSSGTRSCGIIYSIAPHGSKHVAIVIENYWRSPCPAPTMQAGVRPPEPQHAGTRLFHPLS